VSRRVFVHIGLPKTGTSYLQAVLWGHRDELRDAGLLLPGREKRDHLLSSLIVRQDPGVRRRGRGADQAWSAVRKDARAFDGDALISHEFFCAASANQAEAMVADLAPAEVHLVITARDPLGIFTSSWQEHLKNKGMQPLEEYGRRESDDPRAVWNWRSLDLGLVLGRWGGVVPADRVHVVVVPGPEHPREELWGRFCGVVGLDPAVVGGGEEFANPTMGVVEAETLRRVNRRLRGSWNAYYRGRFLRTLLADRLLAARAGEPFWPAEDQIADARARGRRAVELVRAASYDVVGDVDDLLVPEQLPERRHPSSVTDAEVADVAVTLVASLLGEVRDRSTLPDAAPPRASDMRTLVQRLRRRLTGR
jgi:hypothetical protein